MYLVDTDELTFSLYLFNYYFIENVSKINGLPHFFTLEKITPCVRRDIVRRQ